MSCLNRGASLAVLAIFTAPVAAAAQSAPEPVPAKTSDSQVEALVVTGYALGNQLAVESKQAADTTADFLVADEVNRMPDYNVSDAFRRAPGVYTVFDEDEGRYVGIRGLNPDFTIAQFNGALISSSERDNRRVNLEAIPSSAVKRLEVFKSRTANLEGNAIGGTVNLVTRSAFDAKGFYLAGSGGVGYTDHQVVPGKNYRRDGNNGPSYRGDLTASDTFFDDRIGVVLSGSFMERRRDQQRYQAGAIGSSVGGLPVTPSVTYAGYPNTIDRFGGFAKFEFKPVDGLYIDAVVSRYTQEDKELRYQQILTMRGTQTATGSNVIAFPQGQALIRFNDYFIQKPVVTAQSHLRWDISEKQNFRAGFSYSHAMWHEPSNQPTFTTANNSASLGGAYSYDDGTPVVTLNNTAFYLNPANYGFTNYIKYDQHNKDYVYQYNADYSFNTGRSDYGFGIDAGAEFRKNIRDFDDDRTTWTLRSGNSLNAANFILGGESFTGPFANQDRLILDGGAFFDYFDKNTALFQGAVDNTSADYRFDEQVSIAYGQAVYRGDRYKVLAGLRWERTETELKRPRVVNGAQAIIVRTNEYDNFLPSVTGWYNLTQNLKLRASYFKAVGRPNPIDLAGSEAVTIGSDGTPQISRGNPDLKARTADSYDASLEYYFPDRQGLVSIAVFDKQIKNEIFRFRDELLVDGVETRVTQPRNVAKASVKGVELAYTQNNLGIWWRPLTGVGVNTNLSLFEGYSQVVGDDNQLLREIDQLREQPKTILNATVFYKHKAFETRLTYARSSSVPTSIATAATATSDARDLAYSQLDWSARYKLSRQLQLMAEVRNLANATKTNVQTSDFGDVTRDYNIYGRTLFFGVSFKY